MNKTYMKKVICLIVFWMGLVFTIAAQTPLSGYPLEKAKRILFLGNSITYAGDYVSLFECFYRYQYPASETTIINAGLPSETVSGLSEPNHADGAFPRPWLFSRFTNVLTHMKPDVVFACYGMNDGIYLPFDSTRFRAYKNGMERLHQELERAGVQRIIFLTPPVHDDPKKALEGYNLVLDRYAHWLLQQGKERGWEVVDIHLPMRSYLQKQRRVDPAFRLAADGVHPGKEGHWLMARSLMAYFDVSFKKSITLETYLHSKPGIPALYKLIRQRQAIMKDAWLTYTGHDRPGMAVGLPMEEANKKYKLIEMQMQQILTVDSLDR